MVVVVDVPQQLPLPQEPHSEGGNDQQRRQEGGCDEAFLVLWRIDLLPNDEREPGLQHVGHLVHCGNDDRPLLIIVTAYLMSPAAA